MHGCGKAAHQAARKQLFQEHKVYPGSGSVNHKPNEIRKAQLEHSINKRISELESKRKRKAGKNN